MVGFKSLLAVCCELREGLENNKWLKDCKKIGEFLSIPEFTLIKTTNENGKLGLKKGSSSVVFEVYEVNIIQLHNISELKGFYYDNYNKNIHDKIEIETPYGKAYTYLEKHTKITNENIIKDYDFSDYSKYNKITN